MTPRAAAPRGGGSSARFPGPHFVVDGPHTGMLGHAPHGGMEMLARTLIVVLTATLVGDLAARAAVDPSAQCASTKRAAAGKKAAAKLKCWAKSAKVHMPADPTC